MPRVRKIENFEFADEITPQDIMNALDVDEICVPGFLDGSIAFKRKELERLADYKGIAVEKLRK